MNKIALLNDALRRTLAGGKVVMTRGVAALGEADDDTPTQPPVP